jgi:hypothetical protein
VRHTAHPAYSGRSALLVFAGYPIANRIRRRGHARCPYACEDQKAATGIHKFPLHSFIPEKVAESPAELEPAPARDGSSRPGGDPPQPARVGQCAISRPRSCASLLTSPRAPYRGLLPFVECAGRQQASSPAEGGLEHARGGERLSSGVDRLLGKLQVFVKYGTNPRSADQGGALSSQGGGTSGAGWVGARSVTGRDFGSRLTVPNIWRRASAGEERRDPAAHTGYFCDAPSDQIAESWSAASRRALYSSS